MADKRKKNNSQLISDLIDKFEKETMKYNGQTKAEYQKNFKRVADIIDKSDGDKDHAIRLAQKQANAITDEMKCVNRAMAAKDMGHEHVFEVFFQKAYELGSVSKQDYRQYKLEKLGL
jgi:hypothetical protein